MYTLVFCVCLLILGYFLYGSIVEKVWGVNDKRLTPAVKCADGVDFVSLSPVKAFLIQFLNIAGLGPVFGAVLGAVYGPVCYLWIVLGSIFAGAVHDFLSGMVSVKFKGKTIIYLTEKLFGKYIKFAMLLFFVFLLLLIGTVFAFNPAKMLADLFHSSFLLWTVIIFTYYFLATLLPVDKIIGRFYPVFAFLLITVTISLLISLFACHCGDIPNLTFENLHPTKEPIFPILFITVACGAISGFHATQSPIISRCLSNEKYGRPVFYGAMITEGLVALIWATLGVSFYKATGGLLNAINTLGQAGTIADISTGLLGKIGGSFAILSIVVLSITSGDTAFRSARLVIADFFNFNQKNLLNRFILSTIVLSGGIFLGQHNLTTVWLYCSWANQTLACFVLWTISYYLKRTGKNYWIVLLPAIFMTTVCCTYILHMKIGFNLSLYVSKIIGFLFTIIGTFLFFLTKKK